MTRCSEWSYSDIIWIWTSLHALESIIFNLRDSLWTTGDSQRTWCYRVSFSLSKTWTHINWNALCIRCTFDRIEKWTCFSHSYFFFIQIYLVYACIVQLILFSQLLSLAWYVDITKWFLFTRYFLARIYLWVCELRLCFVKIRITLKIPGYYWPCSCFSSWNWPSTLPISL